MKSQISRYGIPNELIPDNGPQFACEEFAQFMKDYDIKQTTSSPYHPQANGQAERTVQSNKLLNAYWWKRKILTKHYLTTETVLETLDSLLLNCSWADGWRQCYWQHPNSYSQDMAIPRSVTLKWSLVSRSRNSTSTRRRVETCRHFKQWSSPDEVWGHLEESWCSDSSLDSQILCSQTWV